MAALNYASACGCGIPLKMFKSSGRTAKSCSRADCYQNYKKSKILERYHAKLSKSRACLDCGKGISPLSPRCRKCARKHMQLTKRKDERVCVGCGVKFQGWAHSKYCSIKCHDVAWALKQRKRDRVRNCKYCGARFELAYGDLRSSFCSTRCGKKAHQGSGDTHMERVKRYGVPFERVYKLIVFERDGWRCQICGKDTPRNRRGTRYGNAPELDHRIPISKLGPHTYANTQCACRECNMRKGNKLQVGQIPLWNQPPTGHSKTSEGARF